MRLFVFFSYLLAAGFDLQGVNNKIGELKRKVKEEENNIRSDEKQIKYYESIQDYNKAASYLGFKKTAEQKISTYKNEIDHLEALKKRQ